MNKCEVETLKIYIDRYAKAREKVGYFLLETRKETEPYEKASSKALKALNVYIESISKVCHLNLCISV